MADVIFLGGGDGKYNKRVPPYLPVPTGIWLLYLGLTLGGWKMGTGTYHLFVGGGGGICYLNVFGPIYKPLPCSCPAPFATASLEEQRQPDQEAEWDVSNLEGGRRHECCLPWPAPWSGNSCEHSSCPWWGPSPHPEGSCGCQGISKKTFSNQVSHSLMLNHPPLFAVHTLPSGPPVTQVS